MKRILLGSSLLLTWLVETAKAAPKSCEFHLHREQEIDIDDCVHAKKIVVELEDGHSIEFESQRQNKKKSKKEPEQRRRQLKTKKKNSKVSLGLFDTTPPTGTGTGTLTGTSTSTSTGKPTPLDEDVNGYQYWYGVEQLTGSYLSIGFFDRGGIEGTVTDLQDATITSFSIKGDGRLSFATTNAEDFLPEDHLSGDHLLPSQSQSQSSGIRSRALDTTTSTTTSAIQERELQQVVVIGVMVVWTKEAECKKAGRSKDCNRDAASETIMRNMIDQMVEDTNTAFAESGVNGQILLVHAYCAVQYNDPDKALDALEDLQQNNDKLKDADGVRMLVNRESYGADLVNIVANANDYCGIAYTSTGAHIGYSMVHWSCTVGNKSFAHELGHNLSCSHDRAAANKCGTSNGFNYGYRDPNADFRTIQSYSCSNSGCSGSKTGSCGRILRYANDGSEYYYDNKPTGTPHDKCAQSISNTISTVANYIDVPLVLPDFDTDQPSEAPSEGPSPAPTDREPSAAPSATPSLRPSSQPTPVPSVSVKPSSAPSDRPSLEPSEKPSQMPTSSPSLSSQPSSKPSVFPTSEPSPSPSQSPTDATCDAQVKYNCGYSTPDNGQTITQDFFAVCVLETDKGRYKSYCLDKKAYSNVLPGVTWLNNDDRIFDCGCCANDFQDFCNYEPYHNCDPSDYICDINNDKVEVEVCYYRSEKDEIKVKCEDPFRNLLDKPDDYYTGCGSSCDAMVPDETSAPTVSPTKSPSASPSDRPSDRPSQSPSDVPSSKPTPDATTQPTKSHAPTDVASGHPTGSLKPSSSPSDNPSKAPSDQPSSKPSAGPSSKPSLSASPSALPSQVPSISKEPSGSPSGRPSHFPSDQPSPKASAFPSSEPSSNPSDRPSKSQNPSSSPSGKPSQSPSDVPSDKPTPVPNQWTDLAYDDFEPNGSSPRWYSNNEKNAEIKDKYQDALDPQINPTWAYKIKKDDPNSSIQYDINTSSISKLAVSFYIKFKKMIWGDGDTFYVERSNGGSSFVQEYTIQQAHPFAENNEDSWWHVQDIEMDVSTTNSASLRLRCFATDKGECHVDHIKVISQ